MFGEIKHLHELIESYQEICDTNLTQHEKLVNWRDK